MRCFCVLFCRYPANWTDYSSLHLNNDQFFENALHLAAFSWTQTVERLHKPVSKDYWAMSTDTVNAYYDPSLNSINFPAGIIQPPFFSALAPAAINFGGIGSVMGHEIGHGFDDQGRQFDAIGRMIQVRLTPSARYHSPFTLTRCVATFFSGGRTTQSLRSLSALRV